VWGTQGIHPHEAEKYSEEVGQLIRSRLSDDRIVAVGEIGLDYYYDHADPAIQRDVFEQQLQLAVDSDMPIVVHTRDADEDTRAILDNFSSRLKRKGVIHSFTSGIPLAEYCLAEGFCLGFNGIATFNAADNVRAAVAVTPLDQLLLETDAPYLTPVPYRGKPNAPYYLPFVAEKVAQVKGYEVEHLLKQTWRNSMALFFAGSAG
jgi:TatD DNase family protein